MKITFLIIFIYLFYCCSLNDDYDEDDITRMLYYKYDERLIKYDAILEQEKRLVWQEEFDNNDSKWPIDITVDQGLIINNGCLMGNPDYLIPFSRFYQIPVTLEHDKNYEIEIAVNVYIGQIISLCNSDYISNNSTIPASQFYNFIIENENNRYLFSFVKGLSQICSSDKYWQFDNFNRITIRKIEDKYVFFINSNFFYLLNETDFAVKVIMLWVNHAIMVDYVRFWFLDLS